MTFERPTAGYRQIVERPHANGVRIVGATPMPFAEPFPKEDNKSYPQDTWRLNEEKS
jgi:hypothetical protein